MSDEFDRRCDDFLVQLEQFMKESNLPNESTFAVLSFKMMLMIRNKDVSQEYAFVILQSIVRFMKELQAMGEL